MNVTALKIPEGSPGWYKTDIFTLMSAFCGKELTMKVIKALVLVLIGIQRANSSGPFVQEALAKVFGPSWGPYANLRTVQLLNQLCNESQLDDNVRKDACYGCFFRASNQAASGYPMLLAMATCADTYLNNTNYGHCQTFLRNATNSISTRTSPGIIYCSFLECIRQVNKDMLDANKVGPTQIDPRRLGDRRSSLKKVSTSSNNEHSSSSSFASFHFRVRDLSQPTRNSICVILKKGVRGSTVRPGAEPLDPR
ncbi:uncharacterized protein LOC105690759 isoform X2 [Athalia rosae]|uniref:uncharacterized protein LOC105690759 isoform X2 n=1 Tax=Athalia rosae TaxID=37344 RepID=UPI0020340D49|nr:uncharacterized protein LOC105690759 isoform X2 [Athalia rosae]